MPNADYPHDAPCDHTIDGDRCGETPTTWVGDIYYACKRHEEYMQEWVDDA